jgi:hypothetical protein
VTCVQYSHPKHTHSCASVKCLAKCVALLWTEFYYKRTDYNFELKTIENAYIQQITVGFYFLIPVTLNLYSSL